MLGAVDGLSQAAKAPEIMTPTATPNRPTRWRVIAESRSGDRELANPAGRRQHVPVYSGQMRRAPAEHTHMPQRMSEPAALPDEERNAARVQQPAGDEPGDTAARQ